VFLRDDCFVIDKNLSSAKHSGVRSLFHQNFVKTGIIPIKSAQFYDEIFRNRQKGDYEDLVRFNSDEVKHWEEKAKEFVEIIEKIITQTLDT